MKLQRSHRPRLPPPVAREAARAALERLLVGYVRVGAACPQELRGEPGERAAKSFVSKDPAMMIKWVTIPKFCELTGYTPGAVATDRGTQAHTSAFPPQPARHARGIPRSAWGLPACAVSVPPRGPSPRARWRGRRCQPFCAHGSSFHSDSGTSN